MLLASHVRLLVSLEPERGPACLTAVPLGLPGWLVTRAADRTTGASVRKHLQDVSLFQRSSHKKKHYQKSSHIISLTRTKVDFCSTDSCLYPDKTDSFPRILNVCKKQTLNAAGELWINIWSTFKHLSCQIGLWTRRQKRNSTGNRNSFTLKWRPGITLECCSFHHRSGPTAEKGCHSLWFLECSMVFWSKEKMGYRGNLSSAILQLCNPLEPWFPHL